MKNGSPGPDGSPTKTFNSLSLIFHSSLLLYPDCSFVDDFGPVLEYDLDYSWTDYWLTTVERFGNSGLGNR